MTRREFEELTERVAKNETDANDKFKELFSDFDSEDESQNNQSIDDVSGELGGNSKPDDAKSHHSIQQIRSDPKLASLNDIKSNRSGKNTSKHNVIP